MPRRAALPLALLAVVLGGCATRGAPCPAPGTNPVTGQSATLPDWHDVITDPDHERLRAWRQAMIEALAAARKDGHGAEIDHEGPLLDPDIAEDNVSLPLGAYHCTIIKLGAKEAGHASFIRYPAHRCDVRPSDDITRLIQLDGLQRPSGRLYPDSLSRMVFLGTIVLGDETKPIGYGRDAERDMVGALQRIGARRWRLLLPKPAWESTMDVVELTPEG